MAIAYLSAGSGVSTETSGAALSPLCPATVNAGDILIAHVFWEGTADAPSTPANWTLLSGPHVIESTVARHWVFGKVADGTEDGSAVAFGSPAVTTQRGARVYSFSGRSAGTITELVTGFAATSNANDPQMPTVTTTEAGNLAVALVGQNDNNAQASPTGESGGDWTEAVAEYTAALTPGLGLGIHTCTPTANPGTVSGGSDNTLNDPVGVVGFQIRAAAAQNVAAGTGAITYTGYAPTVAVPRNILADTGVVTYTGYAPTWSSPTVVLPGVGAATYTGYAPTVETPRNIAADTGVLTYTGYAPAVGSSQNVTPDVGVVTYTGFAPTIELPVAVLPGVGVVTYTGYEPAVAIGGGAAEVLPDTGVITYTGFVPTASVSANQTVLPGTGVALFAGFAPGAVATAHRVVRPDVGTLLFAGYPPTVRVGVRLRKMKRRGGTFVFRGYSR